MLKLRILTEADSEEFWALRLKMLKEEPNVFVGTLGEAINTPMDKVKDNFRTTWRTEENYILGAFQEGKLVGCVGFARESKAKLRHKANVWGMYVISGLRRMGIGNSLLKEVIRRANLIEGLEQINLAVFSNNISAKKLYKSIGFSTYGIEEKALKIETIYIDEDLMTLRLR